MSDQIVFKPAAIGACGDCLGESGQRAALYPDKSNNGTLTCGPCLQSGYEHGFHHIPESYSVRCPACHGDIDGIDVIQGKGGKIVFEGIWITYVCPHCNANNAAHTPTNQWESGVEVVHVDC